MDIADQAQYAEALNLKLAIARRQEAIGIPDYDEDGFRVCINCGTRIPTIRVEAVGAIRCIDCQRAYEKTSRLRGSQ